MRRRWDRPRRRSWCRSTCAGCHSERGKAGGLSLAGWDTRRASEQRDITEKMIHKLRAGMMPPSGARRPAEPALSSFVGALESRMDALAAANPDPGWRPFQRLNRAEYAREIKYLLGLDVDVTAFLPPDTTSDGFDNVADVQTFSPTLMEGYLRAASRIAMLAVGDPDSAATQATYKLPKTASQLERAEGAPPGTRGGISVDHTFPADGEYVFSMDFFAEPLGLLFGSSSPGEQIEVSLDGARLAIFDINPRMSEEKTGLSIKTAPISVKAGSHRVTAAFVQRFEGLINDLIAPIDHTMADTEIGTAFGITTLPHLRSLSVVGPHRVTGVSDTPSRRKVFTCRATVAAEETSCAAAIVRNLSTQAFRRPVSEKDSARLMEFYARGRKEKNFEFGVTKALEAILASPQFLFRVEESPRAGYRLGDYELASRLSFFLWGTGPDAELLKLAGQGRLALPGALAKQARRMLLAPRADALATRFASQWLRLQDLDRVMPDPILYPYADHTLSLALRKETELFFESLVREDRGLFDLLTADYTYVNERVARHYGLANVTGNQFRRVTVPDERRGILGHGSVLTLTSIADRTSPVMRGKWVMEVLLGSPPPPPPPNVPALEETKGTTETGRTLVGARAHGAASQQPRVHLVPSRDRSARPGARKLRRHRQVARQGRRRRGRRRRPAVRRHVDRRARGPAQRGAAPQGRVPAQLHAQPDDLRARAPGRGRGHAGGAQDHPRGGSAGLPNQRVRHRHRRIRRVPDDADARDRDHYQCSLLNVIYRAARS